MPSTIRKYWGPQQGQASFNYNWWAIDHDSVVTITASEYTDQHLRFVGDASITVESIVPHGPPFDPNHGVTFGINVDWGTPINVVTDITVFDSKPVETQTYLPPDIDVRVQYQLSNQWCWIAVATSISHYYDAASTWTQCQLMTEIGHDINGFPADTSACPSAQMIAEYPTLAAALANPYAKDSEYILDDVMWRVDRRYLKTGGVRDSLATVGHRGALVGANSSLDQVTAEIIFGRPVVADITFPGIGGHVVVIAGVADETLLIAEPANGPSHIWAGDFPDKYRGGATINEYVFTTP